MKIGLLLPYGEGMITSPTFLREFLEVAEGAGAESVWAVEHVVVADSYEPRYPYSSDGRMPSGGEAVAPMPDPLELLAFAAGVTERLVLGTAVVVAPLHSATVLAKRAATLDLLSGSRFHLGLGIGWQVEEYAAVGAPFERRGARLEDGIHAMRALWSTSPATYDGAFTRFDRVHLTVQPRSGAVPIVLGGNSEAAIERAGRIGDGWFPYTVSPSELAGGVDALARSARAAGRSRTDIEVTVWPGSYDHARGADAALAAEFVSAGADRLILLPDLRPDSHMSQLAEQVRDYTAAVAGMMA